MICWSILFWLNETKSRPKDKHRNAKGVYNFDALAEWNDLWGVDMYITHKRCPADARLNALVA